LGNEQVAPGGRPGDERRHGSARARHLAAAAELVTAPPEPPLVAGGMAGIRLQDLAEATGRSRSSLYKLWPTQEDFWADLSLHLLFEHDHGFGDGDLPWFSAVEASGAAGGGLAISDPEDAAEVMRAFLAAIQDFIVENPGIASRGTLLGYHDLPEAQEVRARALERRLQDLGLVLAGMEAVTGHEVRPPATPYDLAVAFWALGDGFAVLAHLVPRVAEVRVQVDDGRGPRPWGLFSFAIREVLTRTATPAVGTPLPPPTAPTVAEQHEQLLARWDAAQREVLHAGTSLFFARIAGSDAAGREATEGIDVPAQVTVASVARASGVSRRAVYDLWSSVDELRLDLLAVLLAADRQRIDQLLSRVQPGEGAAATFGIALTRPPAEGRLPPAHASLAYLPEVTHPAVRQLYEQQVERTLALVRTHLDRIWPPRSPGRPARDDDDLAALFLSLIWGVGRVQRFVPHAVRHADVRRDPEGSVVVQVVEALVRARLGSPGRSITLSEQDREKRRRWFHGEG
jgi:AcrR family transcriptional regulator